MNVVFTCDHRFGDASLALRFIKIIKSYVEDPENFRSEDYPDLKPYYSDDKKQKWMKIRCL